ncbi:MAG TPA: NADH-specific enoyl-ACP reductase, partial [Sulfitobacter sp.]|nr:NADH-specific enoyl-ACP reductase [Sulfitobacter sp.]
MGNELMRGKRGLIMGLANDKSIAWGVAKTLADAGAELAFSYQGDALKKRVGPLAEQLGSDIVLPCDVGDEASIDAMFDGLKERWDGLDFIVHAIGFSDKGELRGRYVDTSRGNFAISMDISVYSFTAVMQR